MASLSESSGPQRVAAFLLSLGREEAAAVFRHLDEEVIVEVVEAMGGLDPSLTGSEFIRELDRSFVRSMAHSGGARLRGEADLRILLEKTLGKKDAEALFEKIHHRLVHERPFLALESEDPANVAKVLGEESDAVCGLVLAHLPPQLAAEILGAFEAERSLTVVKRMATLVPPGFDTLFAIAQDLSARLAEIASGPVAPDPAAQRKSVAEILNYSNPETERSVLEGLVEVDEEMATEIREHMFTWEDLASVDRRAMQKILSSVDTRTLSVSLKASSKAVQNNIMDNLSSRVKDMVADERELAGALPMSEVQAAREEIMRAVRALMESGEFRPTRAGEELVS